MPDDRKPPGIAKEEYREFIDVVKIDDFLIGGDVGKSKAVVYIAYGRQYLREAEKAIASVGGQFPCIVCTGNPTWQPSDSSIQVIRLPKRECRQWFLQRCLYFEYIKVRLMGEVDQILFLDTDTYACGDLSGWFDILDRFDIAGVHAVKRQTIQRDDIPTSFPEIHGGAFAVRNNDRVWLLFRRWFEIYKEKPLAWDNDQPPLRQALWEMPFVQLGILPIEYCFRYRWGGLLSQKVVLLHGKEHNTPYEEIARQVNARAGRIRIFHRRELA